ncbi:MAG: CPBP family intramembrane metalloprotease [Bacilli bacterium]|nr:CPBP family intramembrane metalloprotease [Bacilli bacterium]
MKNIWYSIKDIIISYLVIYISIISFILLYIFISNDINLINNPDNIYKYSIIGMSLSMIPLTIYLYKKNYQKEVRIDYQKILLMIPLGISISLFYNMLTIEFQSSKTIVNLNLFIVIIYTAILGPIFEEILFRYTALNKARKNYKEKYAILLVTIVFALMHSGIINMAYAFILGLVLAIIYKKYQNILYPITVHISANFISIFLKEYNLYLLMISLLGLFISIILLKKQKH